MSAIRPLTVDDKLKRLALTGVAKPADLDASFTLTPRAPYVESVHATIDFFSASLVSTKDNHTWLDGVGAGGIQSGSVALYFDAAANRRFLVDCTMQVSSGSIWLGAYPETGGTTVYATAEIPAPSDGHATLVVPKASEARRVWVQIAPKTPALGAGISLCEVTPVK